MRIRESSVESTNFQLPLKIILDDFDITPNMRSKVTTNVPVATPKDVLPTTASNDVQTIGYSEDSAPSQPLVAGARIRKPPQRYNPPQFT